MCILMEVKEEKYKFFLGTYHILQDKNEENNKWYFCTKRQISASGLSGTRNKEALRAEACLR